MRSRLPRSGRDSRLPQTAVRAADRPAGGEAGALGRFRSPLYHQIYLIMRQRIVDGEFGTGGTLPSEQELAEFHGVSRITAKRALDELANDGLVVRERGRGTRVVEGRAGVRISGQSTGAFDALLAMGGETEVSIMEFGYGPAEDDVAAALGLPVGTTVQRSVRVRSVGGDPFSHLTAHVPEEIGRRYEKSDMANTPLLALLERAGVMPATADQAVSATLADMVVADRLGIGVGAPLLRIRRVVCNSEGRAIELLVALYRSDLYRLSMTLNRGTDADAGWSPEAVTGIPLSSGKTRQAPGGTGK